MHVHLSQIKKPQLTNKGTKNSASIPFLDLHSIDKSMVFEKRIEYEFACYYCLEQ